MTNGGWRVKVTVGALGPLYQHLLSLSRAWGSALSILPITAVPFFTVPPPYPRELDNRYASPSYPCGSMSCLLTWNPPIADRFLFCSSAFNPGRGSAW